MQFNDLVAKVKSDEPIKVYIVDDALPAFLTGYAINIRKELCTRLDLNPYVLIKFGPSSDDYKLSSSSETSEQKSYKGLLFKGKFVTTNLDNHKRSIRKFFEDNDKYSKINIEDYLKLAAELNYQKDTD